MPSWIEAVFAFLFKYRPAIFEKGDLTFGAPSSVMILLALGALVALPAVLTYAAVRGKSTRRDRMVLSGLRIAALLVIVLCLFRPMLQVSSAIPQRNYVGVLIDDSQSMQITDIDGKARAEIAARLFGGKDSTVIKALREKWQVRLFRFGKSAERIEQSADLSFKSQATHVLDAVERARQDLDAVPLSGLIVITDGADNSRVALQDQITALRARNIPIFTVGVGARKFERDVEVQRVEAARVVLKGTSLTADVLVKQQGMAGQRVPLVVEDNGRIISQDTVTLPPDGDVVPLRINVKLATAGSRALTFRIPLQGKEQVTQNNQQIALVTVRDAREKVLYFEGEPRYEVAFIRRAIAADSNLHLVVLQRTAEEKFLRLDVENPTELEAGFPKTRAELFKYRSIILGSVEASAFTHDQLQMLAEFVSVRGGGMLFLGGRRAFAEGGYAGTPVADVMPVMIEGEAVADSMTFIADLRPMVTPQGAGHNVTQVSRTPEQSARRWQDSMPIVTSVNYIKGLKPGAVMLIKAVVDGEGRSDFPDRNVRNYEQPILAYQRYGRGISIALPVQDTYLWQMDPKATEKDVAHQTFWRQLLRWLTSDVPGRVRLSVPTDQISTGGSVTLRSDVVDSLYVPRNDARVIARVRGPNGVTREVPMEWAVDKDGEYRAGFAVPDSGLYTIVAEAASADGTTARDSVVVRVGDLNSEYINAEKNESLLKRMAEETEGKYYDPDKLSTLAEDLALSKAGVTVVDQKDLWDMPIIFFILVALIGAEWAYRKSRGLA